MVHATQQNDWPAITDHQPLIFSRLPLALGNGPQKVVESVSGIDDFHGDPGNGNGTETRESCAQIDRVLFGRDEAGGAVLIPEAH